MCSLSPTSERRAAEAAGKSAPLPDPLFICARHRRKYAPYLDLHLRKAFAAHHFSLISLCAKRRRSAFRESDPAYIANLFLHCGFPHPQHAQTAQPPLYFNRISTEKALPKKCLFSFSCENASAVSNRRRCLPRIVKTSRALSAKCHTPEKHRLSVFVRSIFQQSVLDGIRKMNQR